jgi:monoamine oxidase
MIRRGFDPNIARIRAARARARAGPPAVPLIIQNLRGRWPDKAAKVIIVGAGLAGLTAAFELENLGFEVIVLEADKRHIGGRVRTLRFDQGYGEVGAMRIPAGHDLTRFYVDAFGLTLRQFVQNNGDAFLLARGDKVRMKDPRALLSRYDLTDEEIKLGDIGLWKKTVGSLASSLTDDEKAELRSDHIVSPRMQALDRQSLHATFAQFGLSPGAIQLMASTWDLDSSLPVSMTEHLREEDEHTWFEDFGEIVGGTDRLPAAFAGALKKPVSLGSQVVEIVQEDSGVTANYMRSGGERRQVTGDWLICTLPLGVLKRIDVHPPLSGSKQDAIRRFSYDSATKVLALTKRRFWETDDGIYGGGSVSDGILGSTWYPSDNARENVGHPDPDKSAAPSVFLASYSWGQTARRMAARSVQEMEEMIVLELGKLHDSIATDPSQIEHLVRWSWDEHPLSAGAYAFCQPGDHLELFEALVAPEGRILLAGEHASFNHSWMQGAIFSGLRAATHLVENNR